MPIAYRCPYCGAAIRFEGHLAGRVACQQCGTIVTLPTTQIAETPVRPSLSHAPEAPVRDLRRIREASQEGQFFSAEEHPRLMLRASASAPGWSTVRTALAMMFWSSIAIIVLGGIVLFVRGARVALLVQAVRAQEMPLGGAGSEAALLPLVGGVIVAVVVCFVGYCMCCAVPAESQARRCIVGSILCWGVAILLAVGLAVFHMEAGAVMFLVAMVLVALAGHILFIVFLKIVAGFFGNQRLARTMTGYLVLSIFSTVFQVLTNVILVSIARGDPGPGEFALGTVFECINAVLGIAAGFWFLVLIAQTKNTIGQAMTPQAD